MNKWFARIVVSAFLASAAFALSAGLQPAGAKGGGRPPRQAAPVCSDCHQEIYVTWRESAHGRGLSCGQCHLAEQQDDHAREGHGAQQGPGTCMSCHTTGYNPTNDTWVEDNVHCTACHTPVATNHPAEPMPIVRSADLCGQCHIEANLEWQTSRHGQAGVLCVSCHNQHATSLRAKDVSEECANCHGARVRGFSHSEHHDQGLSCADCHLAPLDVTPGEGNAKRDHTFTVRLSTCTNCHAYQLHNAAATPGSATTVPPTPVGPADAMSSNVTSQVTTSPAPLSPLGLAAAAGMAGLLAGSAAMSWLKNLVERILKG